MDKKTTTHEFKKEGTPNKGTLQSYLQNFTKEAIDEIVYVMRNSRNENLRFGAAKVIVDKSIPDVKAVELTGENNGPILIKIVEEIVEETNGNKSSDQELSQTTVNL